MPFLTGTLLSGVNGWVWIPSIVPRREEGWTGSLHRPGHEFTSQDFRRIHWWPWLSTDFGVSSPPSLPATMSWDPARRTNLWWVFPMLNHHCSFRPQLKEIRQQTRVFRFTCKQGVQWGNTPQCFLPDHTQRTVLLASLLLIQIREGQGEVTWQEGNLATPSSLFVSSMLQSNKNRMFKKDKSVFTVTPGWPRCEASPLCSRVVRVQHKTWLL